MVSGEKMLMCESICMYSGLLILILIISWTESKHDVVVFSCIDTTLFKLLEWSLEFGMTCNFVEACVAVILVFNLHYYFM